MNKFRCSFTTPKYRRLRLAYNAVFPTCENISKQTTGNCCKNPLPADSFNMYKIEVIPIKQSVHIVN